MNNDKNLISSGAGILGRTKRYLVWFFLLNLTLASMGAAVFRQNAGGILNNSLYADRVLHGLDVSAVAEMFGHREMGTMQGLSAPAADFAFVFFLFTLIFLPGVLLGYASDHRLPRAEFFRACGRNLWRFVRIFLLFAIVAGIICGILFGIQAALVKAADKTSNELLPFYTQMACLAIIFLVATTLRIWFDLAEIDVVMRDQNAVRKSIGTAYRATRANLWRLLGTYVLITVFGAIGFGLGLILWHSIVPSSSVAGAFIISQLTLLIWLIARFWQRASAVAFYVRAMEVPVAEPTPRPAMYMPSAAASEGGAAV